MSAPVVASPTKLTILYDEGCEVCRRARDWLLTQPCLVPVELLAAGSDEAKRAYGSVPGVGKELVVVDDAGNAWVGPSAFIASMWATARYRSWAYRLSQPRWAPYAERFFTWVSDKRRHWSVWLDRDDVDCSWCDRPVEQTRAVAACVNGHLMRQGQRYCTVCGWPGNVS
jgi:predicted DCC family thiol-disulfide oxidoreductase YuxK